MGIELTQWTLVKPGRLDARRAASDSIWLKSPSGEMELLPVARLSPEVRGFVAELASGSKVPREILGDILAARGTAVAGERPAERPWTFHHLDADQGLYVFLNPPPERQARPVAFSLAGQPAPLRKQLELLTPGDAVAEEIVAALRGSASEGVGATPSATPAERAPRRS
jgi:hypothetical protein